MVKTTNKIHYTIIAFIVLLGFAAFGYAAQNSIQDGLMQIGNVTLNESGYYYGNVSITDETMQTGDTIRNESGDYRNNTKVSSKYSMCRDGGSHPEYISACDFVCSDSDCEDDFETAIDYMYGLGGGELTVLGEKGAFYPTFGAIRMRSNVDIIGVNDPLIFAKASFVGIFSNADQNIQNVTVKGLTLDCNVTANSYGIILTPTGKKLNIVFDSNTIMNCKLSGIRANTATSSSYAKFIVSKNNEVTASTYGIDYVGNVSQSTIRHNHVHDSTISAHGIMLQGNIVDTLVTENQVYNLDKASAMVGILVYESSMGHSINCEITNNILKEIGKTTSDASGIFARGEHLTITDNKLDNIHDACLDLNSLNDSLVEGNTCYDADGHAIYLTDFNYGTVTNNKLINCGSLGARAIIQLTDSSNNLLSLNTGRHETNYTDFGIRLDANSHNNQYYFNDFQNVTTMVSNATTDNVFMHYNGSCIESSNGGCI